MNKLYKDISKFLSLCYERKEKGIKYAELEKTVSKETISWLMKNHYISHKRNSEYIWIAWTNRYHANCTIRELKDWLLMESIEVIIDDNWS